MKFKSVFLIIFIPSIILIILISASLVNAETPFSGSATKVRSDDGKHAVIKEACTVCHKEEEFEFLIMIYSTKKIAPVSGKGGDMPLTGQQVETDMEFAPTVTGQVNFHQAVNCLFCHQKGEGNEPAKDKFITLDGKMSSLCTLCHNDMTDTHFLATNRVDIKEIVKTLEGYGLKLNDDGTLSCVTCHSIHAEKVFGKTVNEGFKPFIVESSYYNPHGSTIACIACHDKRPEPKQRVTFIDEDKEKICRKCHIDDIEGHHVTKVASTNNTYLMDFLELPLYKDEQIYCSTCHDEVCYKGIDKKNKTFLRNGPYENIEVFCNNCHKKEIRISDNPHKQIDAGGNVSKLQCAVCHMKFPEGDDVADLALVSPVTELCTKCHKIFPHPDLDHLVEISGVKLDNLESYQDTYKINFPLGDNNQITCATCHNPHDKGVLKGLAGVGAGEYMSLRGVSFEEACTPCHGKIY